MRYGMQCCERRCILFIQSSSTGRKKSEIVKEKSGNLQKSEIVKRKSERYKILISISKKYHQTYKQTLPITYLF